MNHHSVSHRTNQILLAFCLMAILLGLTLFFPRALVHAAGPFTVNDLGDAPDDNAGDGFCHTAGGVCTLRAAIEEANAFAGADTINITVTGTIVVSPTLPSIAEDLTISGPGRELLTISGGNAVQVMFVSFGVTLNLSNVTIANGKAAFFGGGIYNDGILNITNSKFMSNTMTSSGYGGGIYNLGILTVISSTFSSNSVLAGSGGGGGIWNDTSGTLTITNSTFYNNRAPYGGGVFNNFGGLLIANSTFSHNIALAGCHIGICFGNGGGIYNNNGSLNVTDSAFAGNGAAGAGGGIADIGMLNVTNTTFYSNSASSGGGIIITGTLTVTMTNSTLSGNGATDGGGIRNSSGVTVKLRNTIVANSIASGNCSGTITDDGNNLQFGGTTANSCGGTISTADPKLGPLANNGGATQTMALSLGSAAIDAGNDAICPGTDQRGWHRPFGPHCDIGAYERGAYLYLPLILK